MNYQTREAHVDDVGAVAASGRVRGPDDGLDNAGNGTRSSRVEHAHGEDRAARAHPRPAHAVVLPSTDRPGDMRPVPVLIERIEVVVDDVQAEDHLAVEVRVRVVDATVEHGDHDVLGAEGPYGSLQLQTYIIRESV